MLTEFVLNVLSVPLSLLFILVGSLLSGFGVSITVDQLQGLSYILSCVGYFVPLPTIIFILSAFTSIYTARFVFALFRIFVDFNKTAGS